MAGTYHVEAEGETLECTLRGRVKHRDRGGQVAVGDRVRVERLPDGACRIRELLPRKSALSRLGVARRREQVIAANVDQIVAVLSVARPDPDFSMLDRLLVLGELNRLAATVVANKVDLLRPGEGLPTGFEPYRAAGYRVLSTSAERSDGLAELRARLVDRVSVLTGPSGTGKSSLLNALDPGLSLRIGRVGTRKGRGRHTTVSAALYPFPPGGYVADTPGLQYLALWEADPADLSDAFPEFRELAPGCRFADCRHRAEPACAVCAAVEAGEVARSRYESYLALVAEAEGGR